MYMCVYVIYTVYLSNILYLQNIFDHEFNEKSIILLFNIYWSGRLCQTFNIHSHRTAYLKSLFFIHTRVLDSRKEIKGKIIH